MISLLYFLFVFFVCSMCIVLVLAFFIQALRDALK